MGLNSIRVEKGVDPHKRYFTKFDYVKSGYLKNTGYKIDELGSVTTNIKPGVVMEDIPIYKDC